MNISEVSKLLESKTLAESARCLEIPYQKLNYFCKKNNLIPKIKAKRGRENKTDKYKEAIVSMYENGYSQDVISKKIGVSRRWIREMLEKEGIEIRSLSEVATIRHQSKTKDEKNRIAAAANAVRHAMGILNLFN